MIVKISSASLLWFVLIEQYMRNWVRVFKNIEATKNLAPLVELNKTTKFSSLKSVMIQRIVLGFRLSIFSVQYTIIFYNWMADNNGRRYGRMIDTELTRWIIGRMVLTKANKENSKRLEGFRWIRRHGPQCFSSSSWCSSSSSWSPTSSD